MVGISPLPRRFLSSSWGSIPNNLSSSAVNSPFRLLAVPGSRSSISACTASIFFTNGERLSLTPSIDFILADNITHSFTKFFRSFWRSAEGWAICSISCIRIVLVVSFSSMSTNVRFPPFSSSSGGGGISPGGRSTTRSTRLICRGGPALFSPTNCASACFSSAFFSEISLSLARRASLAAAFVAASKCGRIPCKKCFNTPSAITQPKSAALFPALNDFCVDSGREKCLLNS